MSSENLRQGLQGIFQLTDFRNFNVQWLVLLRVMRKHKNGHVGLVALKPQVCRCSLLHSVDSVSTAHTDSCIGCWEKLSHVNGNVLAPFDIHLHTSQRTHVFMGFSFLVGTFGKPLRRPHLDAFSSFGKPPDCQPRPFHVSELSSAELDSESEEDAKERTEFQEDNHRGTDQQTLDMYRTPDCQPCDLGT